jgi:hypothetical protein
MPSRYEKPKMKVMSPAPKGMTEREPNKVPRKYYDDRQYRKHPRRRSYK